MCSVYGALQFWSNTITVQVDTIIVTLNQIPQAYQYKLTRFSGTVTGNGDPMPGLNVTLYESSNNVSFSPAASNLTDDDGQYLIVYNITKLGTMYYKTRMVVS